MNETRRITGRWAALAACVGLALCAGWGSDPPSAQAEVRDPKGVAVVVGNRNYRNERVPEVSYAHRDAAAFRAYVVEVLGYDPDNIVYIEDADQARLESVFGNERSREGLLWRYLDPEGGSDVVVFYSGHGVPGLKDKRSYLLPVNADPDTAEINGYPIDVLYRNLSKLKEARSVRVFLDACFSGDSDRGMLVRAASPVYVRAEMPEALEKLTVLTAASGQELASWDEKARHGLFTHHLLNALHGAADDVRYGAKDGQVTASEAKRYLDRHMTRAARRAFGRHQRATLAGDDEAVLAAAVGEGFPARREAESGSGSEPVVVAPDAAGKTPPGAAAPSPVAVDEALTAQRAADDDAFTRAKAVGTVESYATYVETYPTGRHTEEATRLRAEAARVGKVFRDCDGCPEMVVVPPGRFQMGSFHEERGRHDNEGPVHWVTISEAFAVGVYEVTLAEWALCVDDGSCEDGWGACVLRGDCQDRYGLAGRFPDRARLRLPVSYVNHYSAEDFVQWLSEKTGETYRLLSESEWEYVARAGTTTRYWWGNDVGRDQVACKDCSSDADTAGPFPVGSFAANGFGLHDVHGNVREWVADVWNPDYMGAPNDGRSWTESVRLNSPNSVVRGGSWFDEPRHMRSAYRWSASSQDHYDKGTGFRVARRLAPIVVKFPSSAKPLEFRILLESSGSAQECRTGCQIEHNGEVFTIRYGLKSTTAGDTPMMWLKLDDDTFEFEFFGDLLYGRTDFPFYVVKYEDGPEQQIFVIEGGRGVANVYYHYFIRDRDSHKFFYLGHFPSLSYDGEAKLFVSSERHGPGMFSEEIFRLQGHSLQRVIYRP